MVKNYYSESFLYVEFSVLIEHFSREYKGNYPNIGSLNIQIEFNCCTMSIQCIVLCSEKESAIYWNNAYS
jgi:hypothetical protein